MEFNEVGALKEICEILNGADNRRTLERMVWYLRDRYVEILKRKWAIAMAPCPECLERGVHLDNCPKVAEYEKELEEREAGLNDRRADEQDETTKD